MDSRPFNNCYCELFHMTKVRFSPDQQEALNNVGSFLEDSDQREYVLTGSPGMGKSFLTQYILSMAKTKGFKLYASATTNKATAVIQDFTNIESFTIHKLLNLRVIKDYVKNSTRLIRGKGASVFEKHVWGKIFVVIDEASMIDRALKEYIDDALKKYPNIKILYVGDKNQIPPVDESKIIIFNSGIPTSELTTIHRQGEGSSIISIANHLKSVIEDSDYRFDEIQPSANIHVLDTDDYLMQMESHFKQAELLGDTNFVKALAYRNKTVNKFNHHIRSYFYTGEHFQRTEKLIVNSAFTAGNEVIAHNESIVTVEKNIEEKFYEIKCRKLTLKNEKGNEFIAYFTKERAKKGVIRKQLIDEGKFGELTDFMESFIDVRPVYSSTIHKAQGSTYENVFLHLEDLAVCPNLFDVPRLVYVALTRARNNVFVYGDLPEHFHGR